MLVLLLMQPYSPIMQSFSCCCSFQRGYHDVQARIDNCFSVSTALGRPREPTMYCYSASLFCIFRNRSLGGIDITLSCMPLEHPHHCIRLLHWNCQCTKQHALCTPHPVYAPGTCWFSCIGDSWLPIRPEIHVVSRPPYIIK